VNSSILVVQSKIEILTKRHGNLLNLYAEFEAKLNKTRDFENQWQEFKEDCRKVIFFLILFSFDAHFHHLLNFNRPKCIFN